MKKGAKSAVKVKVLVTEPIRAKRPRPHQSRRWKTKLLTIGMILMAIAAAASGSWLAIRLILNPGSVGWISWLIPDWQQRTPGHSPQTLAEIRADVAAAGRSIGNPIYLSTYPGFSRKSAGFHDFFLPVYKPQPYCNTASEADCKQLVELRVYRPPTDQFRLPGLETFELVDRISVTGPEEFAAIVPLINAKIIHQGSTRHLPITSLTFVPGKAPLAGVWLHLSGEWKRGSSRVLYGQMIRYQPNLARIQPLQFWTSPAGQLPQWQQVTGDRQTELVVNQTIGLEPQFQVYQFRELNVPGKSLQAESITLAEAVLKHQRYEHGLLLARNGLWSLALQHLQQSKQDRADWPATAQAQLDFVALHARITQSQAKRDWSSPRQQILALWIDGQWSQALNILRTAHTNGYSVSTLLTDQTDRLKQRIEAALRINPRQSEALSLGALLMAVQEDRNAAIAWLRQHTPTNSSINPQVQQTLALLDPPASIVATSPPSPSSSPSSSSSLVSSPTASPSTSPTPRLIGSAIPLAAVNSEDWVHPDPTPISTAAANQTWYEVQVMQFQEGQQWQQVPFTFSATEILAADSNAEANATQMAQTLWNRLGLTNDASLQLVAWSDGSNQPQIMQATIKAIQISNSELRLLAAGSKPEIVNSTDPLLAMTLSSLTWLEPSNTLTLTELSQQPSPWAETLIYRLGQELQQTQSVVSVSIAHPTTLLQQLGHWTIQQMELTGDNQPEAVLTFQVEHPSTSQGIPSFTSTHATGSPATRSHTLIFSSQGELIYSNLGNSMSLRAIVDLGDGTPALIVSDAQGYQLQQWSPENQRFE